MSKLGNFFAGLNVAADQYAGRDPRASQAMYSSGLSRQAQEEQQAKMMAFRKQQAEAAAARSAAAQGAAQSRFAQMQEWRQAQAEQAQRNWQATFDQRGKFNNAKLNAPGSMSKNLSIFKGKDPDTGQTRFYSIQGRDKGDPHIVPLPPGMEKFVPVGSHNTGTHHVPYSRATSAPIGAPIPIENREKAAQTAAGTIGGQTRQKALDELPAILSDRKMIFDLVDNLKHAPAYDTNTNPISGRLPSVFPGSRDFESRKDQLSGEAFVQGFQRMKGAGATSDIESGAAEKAFARLKDATVGTTAYDKALKDFKYKVHILSQRVEIKAGKRKAVSYKEAKEASQFGPKPGAAGPPPTLTPEEAMKLPPGTRFMTTDGRPMRVPGG